MILLEDTVGETLGFISEIDSKKPLCVVRQIIEEEHNLKNFSFTMFGVEINPVQEISHDVSEIVTCSNKPGFMQKIIIEVQKEIFLPAKSGSSISIANQKKKIDQNKDDPLEKSRDFSEHISENEKSFTFHRRNH